MCGEGQFPELLPHEWNRNVTDRLFQFTDVEKVATLFTQKEIH